MHVFGSEVTDGLPLKTTPGSTDWSFRHVADLDSLFCFCRFSRFGDRQGKVAAAAKVIQPSRNMLVLAPMAGFILQMNRSYLEQ